MSRRQFDEHNSHYLNEKNRIHLKEGPDFWRTMDADYNIKTGNTFGETEQITIQKQGWKGRE